jgi:hypothetical protein
MAHPVFALFFPGWPFALCALCGKGLRVFMFFAFFVLAWCFYWHGVGIACYYILIMWYTATAT